MTMTTTTARETTYSAAGQPQAGIALAIVRLTVGAMLVWVFFENLGKRLRGTHQLLHRAR
jgi:hypothetical protein